MITVTHTYVPWGFAVQLWAMNERAMTCLFGPLAYGSYTPMPGGEEHWNLVETTIDES